MRWQRARARDFPVVENRGRLLWIRSSEDPLKRLLLVQGDAVEETQGAGDLIDVRPGILLADKMQLVRPDIFQAKSIR
jgi:hypothetical protein